MLLASDVKSLMFANVNYLVGTDGSACLPLVLKVSAFIEADSDWTGCKADMSITWLCWGSESGSAPLSSMLYARICEPRSAAT